MFLLRSMKRRFNPLNRCEDTLSSTQHTFIEPSDWFCLPQTTRLPCPERGLTGSLWIKDTNFVSTLRSSRCQTPSVRTTTLLTASFSSPPLWCCSTLHSFLLFLFSVLFMLHQTPRHSVSMCDSAWEVCPRWQPALSPTSILSLTPVSSLATCQFGWGPPQWHIGAKSNFITCRCGLQSWGNTRESVPHCHSWSNASPAAVAGQHAAFSEPSAADATSGKPVVTSCQSTAQHRRLIVSPWRQ